ncbi:uncharacterized protein DS421_15g504150 [Arachis hypogaea]|nr:uncharacterized protein DS421_15g504150 [Arachis hypogaea]QHO12124.1 uncharacterized protein DS421_15g504150 [Arachis hypogaea]
MCTLLFHWKCPNQVTIEILGYFRGRQNNTQNPKKFLA